MNNDAEYQALQRFVTADKRFRRFQYALAVVLFVITILGLIQVQQNIGNKIDSLVNGSVARGNERQQESKTIAEETTRYLTCIILLQISDRTPEAQQDCFNKANLPGGLSRSDFTTLSNDAGLTSDDVTPTSSVPAQAPVSSSLPSSPQTTSEPSNSQSDTSQNTISPQPQENILQQILSGVVKPINNLIGGL